MRVVAVASGGQVLTPELAKQLLQTDFPRTASTILLHQGAVYRLAARQVVDFRDPKAQPSEHSLPGEQTKQQLAEAFVLVGRSKVFLFNYGNGNILDWRETLDVMRQDGAGGSEYTVLTKGGNVLLSRSPGDWGARSRFSSQVTEQLRPLQEVGLLNGAAKVWLGNWASLRGREIGTVDDFLQRKNRQLPDHLTLYHGTADTAAEHILEEGLKARPVNQRIWHRDVLSHHPEWRGSAVYLTVDLYQAHYYATKAVNVLRRQGYRGVKPVVLKVVVPKQHFDKFLPDDDYLSKVYGKDLHDPRQLDLFYDLSWLGSLGEMSQVAYLGSIPPEWISVESRLSKQQYQDPLVASYRCR